MVESCIQLFDRLHRIFFYRKDKNRAPNQEDKNFAIAACRSWFDDYRQKLVVLEIAPELLIKIDEAMRSLLKLTNSSRRRSAYQAQIKKAKKSLDALIVDAQISEWRLAKQDNISVADAEVVSLLTNLDPDLERRYTQAIYDLSDQQRISYSGTANELREVIRITLQLKAPDNKVTKKDWFQDARKKPKSDLPTNPTQAERVKFILEKRRASDNAIKNTQSNEELIDSLLSKVVRTTYSRVNAGVHGKENREEIIRNLRYIHAFLMDIL